MIYGLPSEVMSELLTTLGVRVFWKDRESRFLGCNQLFADDAGIQNPADFVGKSDFFFYEPAQATAFRSDDAEVMETGCAKLHMIERLTHANGDVRWLETNKFPLRDVDGNVWGVVGMYMDVTERKRVEELRIRAA